MYSKVLVPLDGSPLSEQVLPYACLVATRLSVPMDLIHVVNPDLVNFKVDGLEESGTDLVESAKEENRAYLARLASSLEDRLTVDHCIEVGEPAEVILRRAESDPRILIAMSTHGRSGLSQWLLGSIAEKTVQAANNPLLLVRGTKEERGQGRVALTKALVPLDGSGTAEQVLPPIQELAGAMGLEVVLLRVYEPYVRGHSPRMRQIEEIVRGAARAYLEEKARQLAGEGLKKVSYRLEQGSAADRIIHVAREMDENLVAMCSHGRSGIKRWMLGSVTARVVQRSEDPVLVIRTGNRG